MFDKNAVCALQYYVVSGVWIAGLLFSFREHGILPLAGKLSFGSFLLHFHLLHVSHMLFISNDLEERDNEE